MAHSTRNLNDLPARKLDAVALLTGHDYPKPSNQGDGVSRTLTPRSDRLTPSGGCGDFLRVCCHERRTRRWTQRLKMLERGDERGGCGGSVWSGSRERQDGGGILY